jgi:hypothetical protein
VSDTSQPELSPVRLDWRIPPRLHHPDYPKRGRRSSVCVGCPPTLSEAARYGRCHGITTVTFEGIEYECVSVHRHIGDLLYVLYRVRIFTCYLGARNRQGGVVLACESVISKWSGRPVPVMAKHQDRRCDQHRFDVVLSCFLIHFRVS